jgi:hypothetical protein
VRPPRPGRNTRWAYMYRANIRAKMIESHGPLVVFGVKSFPDSRDVLGEDAVLVPMTSRLSVAQLPFLTL